MLSRRHRFHGLNSLNFVYRHGQTVRGPQLTLKYAVNDRRDAYRVAVVVSRKVEKSAVVRNRIRRRIYEAVRSQEAAIRQPYDLVFTVFGAQLAELDAGQLSRLVLGELQKSGATRTIKQPPHAIVKPKE